MVRLIKIEEEQYSDMCVTVPLKSGITAAPSNIPFGVMPPDAFKAAIKPDVLTQGSFSVRASVPQSMTNLRLYGGGLSYAMNNPDGLSFAYLPSREIMSAIIFPPDVPDLSLCEP